MLAFLSRPQTTLPTLDYALLKTQIMPRAYSMCLRTTVAGVRAGALALMTQAVSRLDKEEAGAMIDTAAQVSGSSECIVPHPRVALWYAACVPQSLQCHVFVHTPAVGGECGMFLMCVLPYS